MAAPDWEDLDAFFDDDEFATPVVVETQSGETRRFSAIVDYPYVDAAAGIYELDTTAPQLTCPEPDLAGIARGDRADVGGKPYDVVGNPEPDGTGLAVLRLAALP